MRTAKALLLACTLLAGTAQAQVPAGFYVSAGIGVNQSQQTDVETSGNVARALNGQPSIRFEPQAMGVLAVGYGFGNGIRVELEGSLRASAVESASGPASLSPVTQSQGQIWNWGVMANAYVDIPVGVDWIQPYLGVGLGYVWSEVEDLRVNGNRQRLAVDGTDGSLAYQAIAGAAFPIGAIPGLSATAEYRFMGTVDPEYSATLFARNGRNQTGRAEINPYHHAVLFGVRYALGGTPEPLPVAPSLAAPPMAPPPVAAAPAVARSYIVYFGLNSASLTARAREIVAEAAQAARSGPARIEVSGHTDTVGPAAANQRLSMRRAEAVASELRRQGIRGEDIGVSAFGETQLAVATRDGVREPRNRRVEIVVR
ncbi:OmpA family protein [Falsiroseomonas sp. E2-1-a20]|uniref:OmpA family protein n=1 Tax=Falsiroseomonas sp. E2-1-a20 TaxID=3239300 RepID=UPI003F3E4A18